MKPFKVLTKGKYHSHMLSYMAHTHTCVLNSECQYNLCLLRFDSDLNTRLHFLLPSQWNNCLLFTKDACISFLGISALMGRTDFAMLFSFSKYSFLPWDFIGITSFCLRSLNIFFKRVVDIQLVVRLQNGESLGTCKTPAPWAAPRHMVSDIIHLRMEFSLNVLE